MTNLPNLIERLERAEGPSRELFLEAMEAIHHTQTGPCHGCNWCRRFTAMLDAEAWTSAAEMLVPKGWCWMAGERNPGRFRAYVNNNKLMSDPKCEWYEVVCNSTAIALCIAALRAQEADRG